MTSGNPILGSYNSKHDHRMRSDQNEVSKLIGTYLKSNFKYRK